MEETHILEKVRAYDSTRSCAVELVSQKNICLYEQGCFELIEEDVNRSFPAATATLILSILDSKGVREAYRFRRSLVNYKKVLYHCFQRSVSIIRELKQHTSVLFAKLQDKGDNSSRYREISIALARCKGYHQALQESRRFCREICKTHRHPDGQSGRHISPLINGAGPQGLMVHKDLRNQVKQLQRLVNTPNVDDVAPEQLEATTSDSNLADVDSKSEIARKRARTASAKPRSTFSERFKLTVGALESLTTFENIQGDEPSESMRLSRWNSAWKSIQDELGTVLRNPELILWLKKVLIARGAAKCFIMQAELETYHSASGKALELYKQSSDLLVELKSDDSSTAQQVYSSRAHVVVAACHSLYKQHCECIHALLYAQMEFKASDIGIQSVPTSFQVPELLNEVERVVLKYRPDFENVLSSSGWPPDPKSSNFDPSGKHVCWVCKGSFSSLWVLNQVCRDCQQKRQAARVCPYRVHVAGSSKTAIEKNNLFMCPHQLKCFIDDRLSCDACRLYVLDGDETLRAVEDLRPRSVFIDWDQTLCTSKSGNLPKIGKHKLNDPLFQLVKRRLFWNQHICILTRNPHQEKIEAFLQSHLLSSTPDEVPSMHTATENGSHSVPIIVATAGDQAGKANVLVEAATDGTVLFIDDSFLELVQDDRLSSNSQIHRVCYLPLKE